MGIDFNAEFSKLNTNTVGDSANKLDNEECQAAKNNGSIWTVVEGMTAEQFKEANQHCSEYDTNQDGVVTVSEQKASIADQLKNVWTSSIARFFKDDISYDNSDANSAQSITQRVMARIQNALNYIQYAKDNNIDIFDDNTGTGVEDEDGKQFEYTDEDGNTHTGYENLRKIKTTKTNSDGSVTRTYDDGSTSTLNDNMLKLADGGTMDDGTKYNSTRKYNEDGSFVANTTYDKGYTSKTFYDKNFTYKGGFIVTKRGNYKVQAQEGDDFFTTLKKLGITNSKDISAVAKANPRAFANKKFRTDNQDVYIPKEVIANMKANGTYDENKLMGKTV